MGDTLASREDIAWLAGYLEGEGSFMYHAGRNVLEVKIASTDEDALIRAGTIMGKMPTGPYGPYADKPHWKPQWNLTVTNATAYAVMMAVFPFMMERRKTQIEQAVIGWLTRKRKVRHHLPPRNARGQYQREEKYG